MLHFSPIIGAMAATVLFVASPAPGAAQDAQQEERIVVRSGDRIWLPAYPRTMPRSFVCDEHRISYRLSYEPAEGRVNLVIRRLAIDGRNVSRETRQRISDYLATFSSPPELIPVCQGGRVRLSLDQLERGRIVRSETIDISRR